MKFLFKIILIFIFTLSISVSRANTLFDSLNEAYLNNLTDKVDLIINLQGDMPNIKPSSISKLENLMRRDKCEIGTLASKIEKRDFSNPNIVKLFDKYQEKEHYFLVMERIKDKNILESIFNGAPESIKYGIENPIIIGKVITETMLTTAV